MENRSRPNNCTRSTSSTQSTFVFPASNAPYMPPVNVSQPMIAPGFPPGYPAMTWNASSYPSTYYISPPMTSQYPVPPPANSQVPILPPHMYQWVPPTTAHFGEVPPHMTQWVPPATVQFEGIPAQVTQWVPPSTAQLGDVPPQVTRRVPDVPPYVTQRVPPATVQAGRVPPQVTQGVPHGTVQVGEASSRVRRKVIRQEQPPVSFEDVPPQVNGRVPSAIVQAGNVPPQVIQRVLPTTTVQVGEVPSQVRRKVIQQVLPPAGLFKDAPPQVNERVPPATVQAGKCPPQLTQRVQPSIVQVGEVSSKVHCNVVQQVPAVTVHFGEVPSKVRRKVKDHVPPTTSHFPINITHIPAHNATPNMHMQNGKTTQDNPRQVPSDNCQDPSCSIPSKQAQHESSSSALGGTISRTTLSAESSPVEQPCPNVVSETVEMNNIPDSTVMKVEKMTYACALKYGQPKQKLVLPTSSVSEPFKLTTLKRQTSNQVDAPEDPQEPPKNEDQSEEASDPDCQSTEEPGPIVKRAPSRAKDRRREELEKAETDDLLSIVYTILRRLTLRTIDMQAAKIRKLNFDTEERLKGVVELIYDKAISHPKCSEPCAIMCLRLSELNVPSSSVTEDYVTFSKLLLRHCQKEFQRDMLHETVQQIQQELDTTTEVQVMLRRRLKEDLERAKDFALEQSLGTVRFLCELFKVEILHSNIMHTCIMKLLMDCRESSVKCVCRLFYIVGKLLETDKARMDEHFNYIKQALKQKKAPQRVLFMMQELLELRQNDWVPKRLRKGNNEQYA